MKEISEGVLLTREEYQEMVSKASSLSKLELDYLYLKNELEQLKRIIFGHKSERYVPANDGQLSLDFGQGLQSTQEPEPQTEEISYSRKKNKPVQQPVRHELPANLPRIEITIEPETDLTGAKRIGEVVTEILEYNPGKLFVKKYIRPKYAMPREEGIKIAPMPVLPVEKSNAGPGLLAHIAVSKFVDHLPFYRQAQIFKRQGIELSESTLNGWFSSTCRLIDSLNDASRVEIQKSPYLMADETPIPVQTQDKPGATHKGYFWAYYSPVSKIVYFDYQKGRGREGPETFLKNYAGTIQTDGYAAYNIFETRPGITLLACMAHARRKFEHALDNDRARAAYALKQFHTLYEIERQCREGGYTHEQRFEIRQKEALPVMQGMDAWLKKEITHTLPKSSIGEAMAYTLSLWQRLKRYLDNGMYEIDNNLIENTIRPIAIGRKNYLFAGSHEGAQRAALIYSFFGTCKQNGVDPYAWLSDVLDRIPSHKANRLSELLPHNWKKNQ